MAKKTYEQLTFSDDFMFCKVLQNNPELCRELLELILDRPVGELVTTKRQYPIEVLSDKRGVRFDVYAKDDQSVIYDVEMQNALRDHLPKRTRYAQSMIDLDQLGRGAHFSELTRSYVIYICQFNLWKESGRHKYSFRYLCKEEPAVELGDETEKIFLCTEGTAEDISPEMKQFLAYVTGKEPEGELVNKLDDAVATARRHPGWRTEYMDLQDYIDIAREEERENTRKEAERADKEKTRADSEKHRADAAEAELARLKERLAELEGRKDDTSGAEK